MKVYIKNQQRVIKISQQKIRSDSRNILRLLGLGRCELSILLVNDTKMRRLNFLYRGMNKTTDVISFPQTSYKVPKFQSPKATAELLPHGSEELLLGDVVINLQAAQRQAAEHGLSFKEELRWLLVHGILHLIGYDHERSKYAEKKMRGKEKKLLSYMNKRGTECLQSA